MGILGFEVRRTPPKIRVAGTSFSERNAVLAVAAATQKPVTATPTGVGNIERVAIVRAFAPQPVAAKKDDNQRQVTSNPYDAGYFQLPDNLNGRQLYAILRAGLMGDFYRMWYLGAKMMDTWPCLRKCSHELRDPVSKAKFVVKAYCPEGDEPSDSAQEKADLVRRAMANFAPSQNNDEQGWEGMVYDLCDAMLSGLSTVELLWHPAKDWGAGVEKLPRAACWANPRHFTFVQNGELQLGNPNFGDAFRFPMQNIARGVAIDQKTFIVGKFKSQSGSVLAEGFIRPLALDWAAYKFMYAPMIQAAQNFGLPFIDFTHSSGMDQVKIQALISQLMDGLANHVLAHVEGTTVAPHPGATIGSDNPQREIMKLADQHCMELLLGTEGTTKQSTNKLNGDTGGSPQDKTKLARVEGLAKWVSAFALNHFVEAVLLQNYGDNDAALTEKPTIEADFTESQDPMTQATRDNVFITASVPMKAHGFYHDNNLEMPSPGDLVIVGGKVGYWLKAGEGADPDIPVLGAEPVTPPVKLDENNNPIPAMTPEQAHGVPKEADAVTARFPGVGVVKITARDSEELLPLIEAAETAGHRNGQHEALTKKLLEIQRR